MNQRNLFFLLAVLVLSVNARHHWHDFHHHHSSSTEWCSGRTRFVTITKTISVVGNANSRTTRTTSKTTTKTTSRTTTKTTTRTSTTVTPGTCRSSGFLTGVAGACSGQNFSDCCVAGQQYPIYTCSPPVTFNTAAVLTLNGFGAGEDGGGAAECDGQYHSNTELIAAVSTGWYANGSRCGKMIKIMANGRSVLAKVVDECDSRAGCDSEHDYQPPCDNNIVDVSAAVWSALGISTSDANYGWMDVTWTDA